MLHYKETTIGLRMKIRILILSVIIFTTFYSYADETKLLENHLQSYELDGDVCVQGILEGQVQIKNRSPDYSSLHCSGWRKTHNGLDKILNNLNKRIKSKTNNEGCKAEIKFLGSGVMEDCSNYNMIAQSQVKVLKRILSAIKLTE